MSRNRGNNYNNPNGKMSIKEMIVIKHNNKIEEFMRNFKVTKNKCPNERLKPKNGMCFQCIKCIKYAFHEIKEFKNYYKAGKEKFMKGELDGNKKC